MKLKFLRTGSRLRTAWCEGLPGSVRDIVSQSARDYAVLPRMVVSPSQTKNVVAARRLAARRLHGLKFSTTEIGRFLERHPSSVFHLIHTKDRQPPPLQIPTYDPNAPDYSGEWAI